MSSLNINGKSNTSVKVFFFLLYLYLLVSLFNVAPEGGGGLFSQVSAGLFIAFCVIIVVFSNRAICHEGERIYKVVFIFFIYLLARFAILFISDARLAISSIRSEFTILFWVAGLLFCIKEFSGVSIDLIKKYIILLIVLSFVVFFRAIFLERAYLQSIFRIGAVNTAGSAYMLVPLILLALKGRSKFYAYLLCLIVCAWSQKRQALLGFGCVSIFILFDLTKYYFRTFRIAGVFLLILAIVFSSTIVSNVFSGIIERQQYISEKDDVADNGRTLLWRWAMEGFDDAPTRDKIIGGGPGAGARYIETRTGGWYVMPHNGFIEVLCDYGIAGLFIYVLFFIALIRFSFKYPRFSLQRRVMLGLTLAWVMSNIFSHAGRVWTVFLCMALGLMMSTEILKTDGSLANNMQQW